MRRQRSPTQRPPLQTPRQLRQHPLQMHSPLWRALRPSRKRLRTVVTGWQHEATFGEHSLTPRPPKWNGNPRYAFGKTQRVMPTSPINLSSAASRRPELMANLVSNCSILGSTNESLGAMVRFKMVGMFFDTWKTWKQNHVLPERNLKWLLGKQASWLKPVHERFMQWWIAIPK